MEVELNTAEELVWQFSTKLNTEENTCNLCDAIIKTTLATTADIKDHILKEHGASQKVVELIQFVTNSTKLDIDKDLSDNVALTIKEELDRKSIVWKFATKLNMNDYSCNLCGSIFKTNSSIATKIRDHIIKDHETTNEGIELKEFIEIKAKLLNTNKLPKIKSCKKENKHCKCCSKFEYVCFECGFKSANGKSARRHTKSHMKIVCEQCGFQTEGGRKMHFHVLRTHKEKQIQCKQCNYKAKKPSALRTHVRNVHEGFRIDCGQCNRKFTQHNDLDKHLNLVHGMQIDKTFKCDGCDFTTVYRQQMTFHKKKNHEEGYSRKWNCKDCKQRFMSMAVLNQHKNSLENTCSTSKQDK